MVSQTFTNTIVELYGAEGEAWLARLPALIAACERRWSLTVLPPFPNLSYNYVAPAVQAGGRDGLRKAVVLKAGVPNSELVTEVTALRLVDGRGTVRLLEADAAQGVMLLERLRPGTLLVEMSDDEQATTIAAQVMQQLWRPLPPEHAFPSVTDWAGGLRKLRPHFGGGTGPFPLRLVEMAETLFAELLASSAEPVLLHGDLHHFNILAATRRPWLAIDPKGVAGEPAYETGALLRNPMPQIATELDLERLLARRVDQLAELLALDRQRIAGWGVAQAVLSAWWSVEDHGHGGQAAVACAEVLAKVGRLAP
jgi:streptomycin 6-kinase